MKKIMFIVADIYKGGGVQRVVSILSNYLIQTKKYEITVLSLFKTGKSPVFQLDSNIIVENLFTIPFDLRVGYLKAMIGLRRTISKKNIDVFISAGMGYVPICLGALIGKKIRFIAWEHQNFYNGRKFGMDWSGKRIASKKADEIIVLTKQDLESYQLNFRKCKNIHQIYNPIERAYSNKEYRADTRKIISCGSLVSQKGFDFLIEVAKLLVKEQKDWEWHIWGEGQDRKKLLEKIKVEELEKNVILKGYTPDIYNKYNDYSLYVMTSRHEGFGMVLLEAKNCKLPIISFNCKCGPSEMIEDGINGYLIECFEIEIMAKKISELLRDENKLEQFSKKSLDGMEMLDIGTIMERWEQVLDV